MEGANLLNSEESLLSTTLLWASGWLLLELRTSVLERAPNDRFVTPLASLTAAVILHMHLCSLLTPVWTFSPSSAFPAATKELGLGPTRHKVFFLLQRLKPIEPRLQVMLIDDDVLTAILVVGHICRYSRNLTCRSVSFRTIVVDFVKSYRVPGRISQETMSSLLACYSFESRRPPFPREGSSRSGTRKIIDNHLRLFSQSWSGFH